MKCVRFGERNQEKAGIIDAQGNIRDVSPYVEDWSGDALGDLVSLSKQDLSSFAIVDKDVRLGCPIGHVGKIVGIGLNYQKHADEANLPAPKEPIMFLKATSAINGPFDDLCLPITSQCVDWEVELAIVIGKRGINIPLEKADEYIAGYTIANDVSERRWQLEKGTQWTKGKSADNFAPLGPWLVTKDEIGDAQNLDLKLWLNGKLMQQGNSSDMIFKIHDLVSQISEFTTLEPGDVMITGTPPGVGFGQTPPFYLKEGDHLRLQIEKLGEQQYVVCR